MKITCISDTHNKHKKLDVGSGDILIHSGDATGRGEHGEIRAFLKWYGSQDYTFKIFVAGNHDWGFERDPERFEKMCEENDIIYLNDSGTVIQDFDSGEDIHIWGSPVQPEFCNWAFNRKIEEKLSVDPNFDPYHGYKPNVHAWIKPHWDKIPDNTDILITHGPPKGILDEVPTMDYLTKEYERVGCPHLMDAIKRIEPSLHVFGHIHEQSGVMVSGKTTFCNASILNDMYNVNYRPRSFKWTTNQLRLK